MEKILSKLKINGQYVIPANTEIIVEVKDTTDAGIIIPDKSIKQVDTNEVFAVGRYANVAVGDKVFISLARYVRTVPGPHDTGKDLQLAFPEEKMLTVGGKRFIILHESDVVYTLKETNSIEVE
jgi:predicted phosphodiesterase